MINCNPHVTKAFCMYQYRQSSLLTTRAAASEKSLISRIWSRSRNPWSMCTSKGRHTTSCTGSVGLDKGWRRNDVLIRGPEAACACIGGVVLLHVAAMVAHCTAAICTTILGGLYMRVQLKYGEEYLQFNAVVYYNQIWCLMPWKCLHSFQASVAWYLCKVLPGAP